MSNKIIPKHRELTTGEPTLLKGEIASNLFDKHLFVGNGSGNIVFQDKDAAQLYVDNAVAGALASEMTYKGSYNANLNVPNLDDASPITSSIGDTYTITVAGTFFSTPVEIGDMIIAEINNSSTEADWTIVNKNLDNASIKTAYESNANTNEFNDEEQDRVDRIGASNIVLSTAQTEILPAINELDSDLDDVISGTTAISYSGVISGLSSTTVKLAIDEVDGDLDNVIDGTTGIAYSGLVSGLSSTTVKLAIDELEAEKEPNITILEVLRGGTGVTTKTGTGSNVLNDSPVFAGTPTAPNASDGDVASTQIATTYYVKNSTIDGGTY
jgi:hypothetical protein